LQASQDELARNVDCWDSLNIARKCVLIDMNFNMGYGTLSKFKRFFSALAAGDYDEAALEMEDSAWFSQVGPRAEHLQAIMLSGELG
jgi:lysozyme